MSSVNKVFLIGRLGIDPQVHTFRNGDQVVSFAMATSEKWKDKNTGESRESTQWHNVKIFGRAAKVAAKHLRKGDPVHIEGQLEMRKYQKRNGDDSYITEVVVKPFSGRVTFLGSGTTDQRSQARQHNSEPSTGAFSVNDDSDHIDI